MHDLNEEIRELCLRHNRGDRQAAAEFESRFGPSLRRIVGRVLRTRQSMFPLDRALRRAADEVLCDEDPEALDGPAGRRLCERVFSCLAASYVRPADIRDTRRPHATVPSLR